MTQLDLVLPQRRRETIVPEQGTQNYRLLVAFKEGRKLTVAEALSEFGCYALSQRVSELRNKYNWPIKDEWQTTSGGAVIKRYFMEA